MNKPRNQKQLLYFNMLHVKFRLIVVLAIVATTISVTNLSNVYSNQESSSWFEVQRIEASELGLSDFSGLGYLPSANAFYSLDKTNQGLSVFKIRGDLLSTTSNTLEVSNPLNLEYDPQNFAFYVLDEGKNLVGYQAELSGSVPLPKQKKSPFGLSLGVVNDPQGITIIQNTGNLFVLDSSGPYILGFGPVKNDGSPRGQQNTLSRIKIKNPFSNKNLDLAGLAFNPQNNNFYTYDTTDHLVYVVRNNGNIDSVLDLSDLSVDNFTGIAIAPSSDLTDEPSNMNLFIAESGSVQEDATVLEISLQETIMAINAEDILETSLVNIIDGSIWDPPNPDASGLEYLISENRLMVSDSEVEEMPPYYVGVNVFETTNTGTLVTTCDTTHFSVEPSGAAANPDNNHRFFADDNRRRVFEVNPGPDNTYCTTDDIVTSINTLTFNDDDPEGVAYGDGRLFITDGVGMEVNVIHWGANGIFDGLPPAGDDTWTHFDTSSLGLRDPEGIGYHWERGTIFMVSRNDDFILETTITGTPLNAYDISPYNIYSPAGLGIGPGSTNPSVMSVYISDRGVDNNQDPNENDGKIYEIFLGDGGIPPGPTNTPTITATSTLLPTATATNTPGPSPTPSNTPLPTSTPAINPISLVSGSILLQSPEGYMSSFNGPFADSIGNLYLFAIDEVFDYQLEVWKSIDNGQTWSEIDAVNKPTNGVARSIASISAFQNGDTIHLATMTEGPPRVYYHTFRTSDNAGNPDTWGIKDELVASYTNTAFEFGVDIIVQSDGDILITSAGDDGTHYSGRETVDYHYNQGSGWITKQPLANTNFDNLNASSLLGENDGIYLIWKEESGRDWVADYLPDVNSALGIEKDLTANYSGSSYNYTSNRAQYWDDNGDEKIMFIGLDGSFTARATVLTNGIPGTPFQVSPDVIYPLNTHRAGQQLASYGSNLYYVYALNTDGDLYYRVSSNGNSFGPRQQIAADISAPIISVNTYERFGTAYLGIVWEELLGGNVRYISAVIGTGSTQPTATPSATASLTPTATATNTPTSTATTTNTATATPLPPTATETATSTPLPPTATDTATATLPPPTATNTALPDPTDLPPTATAIPPTATNTATATLPPPTATNTATATLLPPTATNTATATLLPPTATNTATATLPPPTATNTATSTPLPPTATNTATSTALPPTATNTATATLLPPTATNTSTATLPPPTATNTATATPPPPTATFTATATLLPPTATNTPTPIADEPRPIYLSLAMNGPTTVGNLSSVGPGDIIYFDGVSWSMVFDGSDVGISGQLDDFDIINSNTILMTFYEPINIPGVGLVEDEDIVRFDATSLGENTTGTFSLYFDGSDVGFDKKPENINAFELLSDGRILISTTGRTSVPGIKGAQNEDIIVFTPTSLGANTAGTWAMYFDGSDLGMRTTINGLAIGSNGDIYLSVDTTTTIGNVIYENEDVFVCAPISLGENTACTFYPGIYFDGSSWNLSEDNVDGISLP